jgi:MYXO-CTERM domain-containing protein
VGRLADGFSWVEYTNVRVASFLPTPFVEVDGVSRVVGEGDRAVGALASYGDSRVSTHVSRTSAQIDSSAMLRLVRTSLALALVTFAGPAFAQVTLPNGLVVPRDSANGETQLFTLFSSRGEAIDWIADARATPDVFSPLCSFSATLVLKQSGSSLGVGWYNVDSPAEIFELLPAGTPVGTTITGTSIREDARYTGGLVGFALIRTPAHYSQAALNTVCDEGPCAGSPGPWILSLSYPSSTVDDAWYLAFEDGDTSHSSWNNDGDYNDYVFLFTGVACDGAGEPCEVADALGICRAGLQECGVGGMLTCRPENVARAETCDGQDEDCDGAIDEGDGLCGASELCFAGVCVPPCFEGGCAVGESCVEGVCVDDACIAMSCDEGLACRDGACIAPCDGVVCPGEQRCRAGRCVDACAGVSCDEGRVCEAGVCVEACECRGCADGEVCVESGACVDAGCESQVCGAGEVCRAGACVDACEGAVCPRGEVCEAGACVPSEPEPGTDGGVVARDGGVSADGGAGLDAGAVVDGGRSIEDASGGCGCRAGGDATGAWLLVALGLVRRRRSGATRA